MNIISKINMWSENLLKYFNVKKPEDVIIAAKKNNENPYPGIIYNAKFIIVTTDSINLLSEAIGSGKEVFVLDLFKPVKRKKIYVKNETPVEFGEPLVLIE